MGDIKKIKPSLPKGTRDFLPAEVAKRNYIFDTIKSVFRKYGFQQIDTPALERLETLTGKYGEEGDKLLFKILNSGNPFKDLDASDIEYLKASFAERIHEKGHIDEIVEKSGGKIVDEKIIDFDPTALIKEINKQAKSAAKKLAEKGLRYDLTVPLSRYVVQHQSDLVFPFKRFHIAPVWRADRPGKGRYQEFYQCDADVIGSTSMLNEVELTLIYLEVFEKLGLNVTVLISSRKFLQGLAEYCNAKEHFQEFVSILDKQGKISRLEMLQMLNNIGNGKPGDKMNEFFEAIDKTDRYLDMIDFFKKRFEEVKSNVGLEGLEEINTVVKHYLKNNNCKKGNAEFWFYLARGLEYYSGIIWEVVLDKDHEPNNIVTMGSLGGGGRYDNLTEMFGGRDMSGVGISFGIERIYDVMEELKLFPAELGETTKVLFVHFDEASEAYAFEALQKVRAADIASEIYPGKKKLDKQMNYANDKKIPYVIVVGGDEMASGLLTFKNMKSGEQQKLSIDEIIDRLGS